MKQTKNGILNISLDSFKAVLCELHWCNTLSKLSKLFGSIQKFRLFYQVRNTLTNAKFESVNKEFPKSISIVCEVVKLWKCLSFHAVQITQNDEYWQILKGWLLPRYGLFKKPETRDVQTTAYWKEKHQKSFVPCIFQNPLRSISGIDMHLILKKTLDTNDFRLTKISMLKNLTILSEFDYFVKSFVQNREKLTILYTQNFKVRK